ncbi:hypothetical protein MNV84_01339 [Leishmania braziliensis]|nr:hypothetical protein MNV84_01339 [Leishmania braziliensis]
MLRRSRLQAVVTAATATVVNAAHNNNSSRGGQLCITVCYGALTALPPHSLGDRAVALHYPLELAQRTTSPSGTSTRVTRAGSFCSYHQSALHASRVLRALRSTLPHGSSSTGSSSTPALAGSADHSNNADTTVDQRGPFEVTIDEVLLHSHDSHSSGAAAAIGTVADLVRLLVDPDLEVGGGAVEAVSLRDFVAMTPKRKLKAVGGNAECLDVLLSSEQYQSEKDARELRLCGVATVGQWKEQPDRVQLSAYARGLLETAYNRLARHRHHSRNDEVVAWLTRAIQRAVADELMAPKRLTDGTAMTMSSTSPFLIDLKVPAVTAAGKVPVDAAAGHHARSAAQSAATATATQGKSSEGSMAVAYSSGNSVQNEAADANAAARRRGPRQRSVVSGAMSKVPVAAAVEEDGAAESEELTDTIDGDAEEGGEEVENEEMAELMAEAEVSPAKRAVASPSPPPFPAAAVTPAGRHNNKKAPEASPTAPRQQQHHQPPPREEVEAADADEDDEELVEEVEEVEEEEAADMTAPPSSTSAAQPPSPPAPAAPPAPPATAVVGAAAAAERRERLVRLAELMMKQFNTADGYLHPSNKAEREAQEARGDILVLDEDTAQVDPLAVFSAYHAATITDADPVAVRALKTIWTSYNKHQMALEEAKDDTSIEFYKRESVNALLYGSVLMRALAREEQVVVLEGTLLPPYGFPLVSSDTRPFAVFAAAGGSSSSSTMAVTDMTSGKVLTALQAYKVLFSSKEKRYSPFRPAVDQSAGCSVVCLSGTTLHLYYTSTKDRIVEEEVRLPFAEVMLGVLHLLRHKVLPRVNVVHYHLIATKMVDPSDSADFMLRSTATIDLTNPFTKEELARLCALATPLGMADEMAEFRCIDDLVIEIEDTSGASVVHSLLHNREDLEATLTATLAQLLPEDGDSAAGTEEAAEDAEEEENEVVVEDEEEAEAAPPPPPPPSRKLRGPAAAPAPSPSPGRSSRRRAVHEENEEETVRMEDEEVAEVVQARPTRAKHRQPAGTPLPTSEAVLEEVIHRQWQQQRGAGKAGAAASAAPNSTAAVQHRDDDGAATEEEEGDFDEELEEVDELEEEAAEPPSARAPVRSSVPHAPAAPGAGAASRAQRSSRAAAAAVADDKEYEDDGAEEIEEEEEIEVVAPPMTQRAPAGRRAVPVAAASAGPSPPPPAPAQTVRRALQVNDVGQALQVRTRRGTRRLTARARAPPPVVHEGFEKAAAAVAEGAPEVEAAAEVDEDQWFRRRPKRRYFE